MSSHNLTISLSDGEALRPVGELRSNASSFSYFKDYLEAPRAIPLSQSLPLREEAFNEAELRPYFEGLLAEGAAREALVAELGLPLDDWISLLEACGRDCIGDVVIGEPPTRETSTPAYEPVDKDELKSLFLSSGYAKENAASRLSLAGTQSKTGLAHDPSSPMDEGWLRSIGLGATTHILKSSHLRDVPEIEFLCMCAASVCGVTTAKVGLLEWGNPTLWVERFDREVAEPGGALAVKRIHQEDFAQALGVIPTSKYVELEGGTVRTLAQLIKSTCTRPTRDLASFARMLVFSYLIGDCDAHLKNYSLLYRNGEVTLAPAYDLVCTTRYPRFSRELAMRLGDTRAIDDVTPGSLVRLASDLGLKTSALQRLSRPIASGFAPGLSKAVAGACGPVLNSTPYIAEDLLEDAAPRLAVLEEFCHI